MFLPSVFADNINWNKPSCVSEFESDTYIISCKNSNHDYESKNLNVICDNQESCNNI